MRIAVIGAGPAGLVTLYTFQKRLVGNKSLKDLEIVCFEGNKEIGGEWVCHDQNEEDPGGRAFKLHGSAYRSLQTNNSYPIMSLHPDFPWQPKTAKSAFPMREDYLKYLQEFTEKFKLKEFIKFNHLVSLIRRDKEQGFKLTLNDLTSGLARVEHFDYILLCCGQHRKPFIPPELTEALASFNGQQLHYHDLGDPERFNGKRLLIVGSMFGALDMAITLAAKSKAYYASFRNPPLWLRDDVKSPAIIKKPSVKEASGSTVTFDDGSSADVDAVIFATGFKHYHPVTAELELDFNKSRKLFPAYKHTVHPVYPRLIYIGKAYSYIIPLCRIQAEFAAALILGKIKLPTSEEMLAEQQAFIAKWEAEFDKKTDPLERDAGIYLEKEIADFLAKKAGCESFPEAIWPDLFHSMLKTIANDVFNYRNYNLASCYPKKPADGQYFVKPK